MPTTTARFVGMFAFFAWAAWPASAQVTSWVKEFEAAAKAHQERRYADAEQMYRAALAATEKLSEQIVTMQNLGALYVEQHKYAEAVPILRRVLATFEDALGPEDPQVAGVLSNLGAVYYAQKKYADAEAHFRRALAIQEKTSGAEAATVNSLGLVSMDLEQYAEAESYFQRALSIADVPGREPEVADILNNLGILATSQTRYTAAEEFFQRAIAIYESSLGPAHLDLAQTLDNYAVLLRKMNRAADAAEIEARANAIRNRNLITLSSTADQDKQRFSPGVLMTDQAKSVQGTLADVDKVDPAELDQRAKKVMRERDRVLDYLRKRWRGEPADESFAATSLNALGLNSIDFAEVVFALSVERSLSPKTVGKFLATGGPNNRKEAILFERVVVLSEQFQELDRYKLLESGVVGDRAEACPFRREFDNVRSLDQYCKDLEEWCKKNR